MAGTEPHAWGPSERLQTYPRSVIMLLVDSEPNIAVKFQGGKDGSSERNENHCRLVRGL